MEIDSCDLRRIDVQSDVANGVLAQGRMFAASAYVDGNVEPLAALD